MITFRAAYDVIFQFHRWSYGMSSVRIPSFK